MGWEERAGRGRPGGRVGWAGVARGVGQEGGAGRGGVRGAGGEGGAERNEPEGAGQEGGPGGAGWEA